MARKPFKIVNDLDLSGNRLIDVREIYRGDYDGPDPTYRDILIRAGNDLTGNNDAGGSLILRSGAGSSRGSIKLLLGNGVGEYGLSILGSSVTTLRTENQDVTINTGTAATKFTSTQESSDPTTGAVQIAGGAYIAKNLVLGGGNIVASGATTWNILNTGATTVNAFGDSSLLNIGMVGLGSTTVNIATAASTSGTKAINIGTNGTASSVTTIVIGTDEGISPSVTLKGLAIKLGTSTIASTTATIGGAVTGNTLKIAGVAAGTTNLSSDITTGTFNLLTDITTGTLNVATGGASLIYLGGSGSSILFGGSSGTTTLDSLAGAEVNLFNTAINATLLSGATGTITLGNAAGTLNINDLIVSIPNAASLNLSNTPTGETSIHIGTGAITTGTKTINLGTGGTTGNTIINIGSTLLSTTNLNGNIVLGDADSKTIALTGTITSAGIKIYDSDSTMHRYTLLPGNITADTTITLPSTTGRYLTVGFRADGLIDMRSLMAGASNTALIPSAGGILYSDADGIQVLAGTPVAGRVLVSGANSAPYWSDGVFSVASGQSFTVPAGDITLTNGYAGEPSVLTIPRGTLTFPEGIVAGDILYAINSGVFTRLGKAAVGSVLVSGDSPSWQDSPFLTALTLSGDLAVNGGSLSSTATTFNLLNITTETVNAFGNASTVNIGKADSLSVINLKTTKDASSVTIAGVLIDGGLGVAKKVFIGSTLDVAGVVTLAADLAVNGNNLTSTATTFNLLNTNITTLNMLGEANATLNIGANDTNNRSINIYADMAIGTTTKTRTINHYGTFNFGGPTGFKIEWNAVENTLDFIKL